MANVNVINENNLVEDIAAITLGELLSKRKKKW